MTAETRLDNLKRRVKLLSELVKSHAAGTGWVSLASCAEANGTEARMLRRRIPTERVGDLKYDQVRIEVVIQLLERAISQYETEKELAARIARVLGD